MATTTLAAYVKAAPTDQAFVGECAAQAEAIVSETLRSALGGQVTCPAELRSRAVLEVGAELFARRGLKNGIAAFGTSEGELQPVRVARDPQHLARELLRPFTGGPFA